jgi:hypothetical protein
MIPHNTPTLVVAAVLLVSGAHLAWAQQKVEEAGIDSFVADHKVFELEKGHQVILVHQRGIETTTDPSMPTNMTNIDCMGMFDSLPDKTFKANGYCTLVDRDGDKIFQRWWGSSDMPEIRYETFGGTGKFEGAKGEGTAKDIELSPGPQGRTVTQWKGSTEYPNLRK